MKRPWQYEQYKLVTLQESLVKQSVEAKWEHSKIQEKKMSNGDKLALGHAYHSETADVYSIAMMVKISEQMQEFHQ